jgi:hypothetical protein
MINTLQLIVRLPLFALMFPPNAQLAFSIMIDLTNFSFFSTKPIESAIFGKFTETASFSHQFEMMGYANTNAVQNMGLMMYYLAVIVIMYLFMGVVKIIMRLKKVNPESL